MTMLTKDVMRILARLRSETEAASRTEAADMIEALHQRLQDAEAAQALVVERAAEAAYEADSLEISLHGANGIAERIRAFAQASGVAALAALRAERDEWKRLAVAGELTARNLAIVQAERDALRARLAAAEGRAEKAEQDRVAEWNRRRDADASRDVARAVCETMRVERDDALTRLAAAEGRVAALTPLLERAVVRLPPTFHGLRAEIRAALATVTPPADTGEGRI